MIFAQAEELSSVLLKLIDYGVLGLLVAGALLGAIRFKPSVDELKADKTALANANNQLVATYEKTVLPALSEAVSAMGAMAAGATELRSQLDKVNDQLGRVEEELKDVRIAVAGLRGAVPKPQRP